jgi:hypothetical protein
MHYQGFWKCWRGTMPRQANVQAATREQFYARALTKAERIRLSHARQVEGLDDEIALLRTKLFNLAEKHPDKVELLYKGIGLLVRALAVKYRLSPKAAQDLSDSIYKALQEVGSAMGLEGVQGNGPT